jgi:hypothetical protein
MAKEATKPETFPEKPRKSPSGAAELNPTEKVALLVRYRGNAREAAIVEAFETFGDGMGMTLTLPTLGLSRRYDSPQKFPDMNVYAPGHEARGYMFVKFEAVV